MVIAIRVPAPALHLETALQLPASFEQAPI
jgi:hypothetical protein